MHITIVEDEKLLAKHISKKVNKNGYTSSIYSSATEFYNSFNGKTDLLLMDISLKDGNGLDLIKWLREKKKNNTPVIIVSGHQDKKYILNGLNIGADDYLNKPFLPEELLARISAVLRRSYNNTGTNIIKYKNIIYNSASKKTTINGKEIELKPKESRLLELLLYNKLELITKEKLITSVWGEHDLKLVSDNTINATISKLRKKLGEDIKIKTLIHRGYILE